MERIDVMVPPPLKHRIKEHREDRGFENDSQAVRNLLRQGLEE